MFRTLGLLALLTPTFAGLATAEQGPAPTLAEIRQQLEQLGKQLGDQARTLKSFRPDGTGLAPTEMVDVLRALMKIEERLRAVEDALAADATTRSTFRKANYPEGTTERIAPATPEMTLRDVALQLRSIQDRLGEIDFRLSNLEKRPATKSTSGMASGTVVFRNGSGLPATVFFNGTAYDLTPRGELSLASYSRTFTYEVDVEAFGLLNSRTTRSIAPGETFIVTINPPR